jgi:hypothetical protein
MAMDMFVGVRRKSFEYFERRKEAARADLGVFLLI